MDPPCSDLAVIHLFDGSMILDRTTLTVWRSVLLKDVEQAGAERKHRNDSSSAIKPDDFS